MKGYNYLLDALAKLRDFSWEMRIIGDGPERDMLQSQANRLGLTNRVRFLGERKDIPDLLSGADLYVQPSLLEGLPTTVTEAMFSCLPVIATTVGGIAEQIDRSCGILVPPANPDELARAIKLVLSTDKKEQMGKAARQKAEQKFSIDVCATKYLHIYTVAAASRKALSLGQLA
ncbi:glycosyltransferase family 4 protein, partial [Mahella australiensis]|uniref:glycosyltransferase family 4 protein n=1 Tax=Mahella australiensis TaxID=252966 RepID=UPI0002ECE6BF